MEQSCGQSLADHIFDIYIAMNEAGAGLACRDTYHALMELAEESRRQNDFTPYTPKGNGFAEKAITQVAQQLHKEMGDPGDTIEEFKFPSGLSRN